LPELLQLSEHIKTAPFPASIYQLDSGLTLIHQYLPATPVAVADVWVRAGAIAEPEAWSGMAHFLEHMIFKGTKRVRPGIFDEIVEHSGGMANAATSHDYAHFFLTTAASYLPETLPYLAEILLHAEIADNEFYRERDVVLEEIRGCHDDPDWLGFQTLCDSLYQRHPYGRCVLGNEIQLLEHTPNQMRCFHRTYYQPENMTVAIVGSVELDLAVSLANQAFSQFSVRSECPPVEVEAEPPPIEVRRTKLYLPRLEQARLMMGWLGPGVEQLQDAFGLDLLSAVLTGGRSARLVRELREERQLVLDVESSFSLQQDSSLFTLNAWLAPEDLERVEKIICDRLFQLQVLPIGEEELARAKRQLVHDYIFSTETPGQLAGLYGYYQTIASAEISVTYPLTIQQFEGRDLQRLASQYLSPERYAVTVMQPC
jgi:predicted Zn-dependent peptidase